MMRKVLFAVLAIAVAAPLFAAGQRQANEVTAQLAGEQAQVPHDGAVLRLEDVVREALQKNPAIASASHTVQAQRAKVPQAKSLPDPTFGVGWMGNAQPFSVQTGDPSSYRSVSAMQ